MQNHLCQILAHYVVYIGTKLNLPIGNDTERFILEGAPRRWHKEGIFLWSNASKHDQQLEGMIRNNCNNTFLCSHNKTADIFTFNNISNLNFVPSDPHELPSISKLSTPELPYLSARGVANFSSVGNPVQLPEPSQPINDTDMPISALNDSLLMSNPFSCWEPSSSPRPKSRCNNFCYIQPAPGQNSTPLSTSKGHGSDDQRNWDLLMQFGSSQQQGINAATLSKQPDKQIPACKLLECSKSFSYGGNY
jgi:hypothetical protein